MKSCFFIGHRDAPESIRTDLTQAITELIEREQVQEFIVGSYGRFDQIVQVVLAEVKEQYPRITLGLLLSYHPALRNEPLPLNFTQTFYPEGMESVPKRYAIVRANYYMVDHSTHLIAYRRYPGSNTAKLVEYTKNREKNCKIKLILI